MDLPRHYANAEKTCEDDGNSRGSWGKSYGKYGLFMIVSYGIINDNYCIHVFSRKKLNQHAQLPGEYLSCDDPQPCHLYSFICPNGGFLSHGSTQIIQSSWMTILV